MTIREFACLALLAPRRWLNEGRPWLLDRIIGTGMVATVVSEKDKLTTRDGRLRLRGAPSEVGLGLWDFFARTLVGGRLWNRDSRVVATRVEQSFKCIRTMVGSALDCLLGGILEP